MESWAGGEQAACGGGDGHGRSGAERGKERWDG